MNVSSRRVFTLRRIISSEVDKYVSVGRMLIRLKSKNSMIKFMVSPFIIFSKETESLEQTMKYNKVIFATLYDFVTLATLISIRSLSRYLHSKRKKWACSRTRVRTIPAPVSLEGTTTKNQTLETFRYAVKGCSYFYNLAAREGRVSPTSHVTGDLNARSRFSFKFHSFLTGNEDCLHST